MGLAPEPDLGAKWPRKRSGYVEQLFTWLLLACTHMSQSPFHGLTHGLGKYTACAKAQSSDKLMNCKRKVLPMTRT